MIDSTIIDIKVGETRIQKYGLEAEVLEIMGSKCRVVLSNGDEKVVSISKFKSGEVPPNKKLIRNIKVGDRVLQYKREYATLIERNNDLCVIRFDNGSIKENVSFVSFARGRVSSRKIKRLSVGDRVQQSCGMYAEILELTDTLFCTVRFEDDTIKKDVYRSLFLSGMVSPKIRKDKIEYKTGSRVVASNGIGLEIIEYISKDNILVRSDDGLITRTYLRRFVDGSSTLTNNPLVNKDLSYLIGKKVQQDCGMVAECIKFISKYEVLVRFSNGVEKRSNYKKFLEGNVFIYKYEEMLGKTYYNKLGMSYTIIKRDTEFLDKFHVMFEDGTCVCVRNCTIKAGNVMPEKIQSHCGVFKINNERVNILSVYFDKVIKKYRYVIDNREIRKIIIL